MENKYGAPPAGFMPPPEHPQQHPPPPYNTGVPPPIPQQGGVFIVQTPALGPDPQNMGCPHCHANIVTQIETEASTKTHIIALLLCLFGCWPCAPCPYCVDSCLAKKHYCPSCKSYLGTYEN